MCLVLTLAGFAVLHAQQRAQAAGTSPIKHVIVISMENTPACAIYGTGCTSDSKLFQYVEGSMMKDAATSYATNFITSGNGLSGQAPHPSAPNYVRMEAGDDYGINKVNSGDPATGDYALTDNKAHFTTLFKQNNISWTRYVGGMTKTGCATFADNATGNYSGDHDGPIYFRDFNNDASYCAAHYKYATSSISDTNFFNDLANNTLPQYAFVQTDDIDSGEKGSNGPAQHYPDADNFLKTVIPKIKASPAYASSAVFVIWDETGHGTTNDPNFGDPKTGLFVMSPFIKTPGANSQAVNIDTVVKTWQRMLGVTSPWLGLITSSMPDLANWFTVSIDGGSTAPIDARPTVTLTQPLNNSSASSGSSVAITGTSSDDTGVTKVDIKVDGTLLKTFTSSATNAFSTTWTAVSGSHTITATATDTAGQTTTATALITVAAPGGTPCTPPTTTYGTVSLTTNVSTTGTYRIWSRMAAASSTANTYLLEIDGNSCYDIGGSNVPVYSANATQHFANDSSNWIAKTTSGSTMDVALTSGNHTLKFYGNADGVLLDRLILTMDTSCTPTGTGDNCANPPDTTPPVVSLTAPPDGTTLSGITTVKAQATDDRAVTKVEFYVDGQLRASDATAASGSSYTYSLDPSTLSNGSHTLTAKAYDAAFNSATSSLITVKVGVTTPPPPIPGDINGDGVVNYLDLSAIAAKYGQSGSNLGPADINGDGAVNYLDLSLLASHYGQ